MPKEQIISNNHSVHGRPQRKKKPRVIFDPSDNLIIKKVAKYSFKHEKPTKATTVIKKTTNATRNKNYTTKTKSILENPVNESLGCSPVRSHDFEVSQEIPNICNYCSKLIQIEDLVFCPICLIKAHKCCLVINEPTWLLKLDVCRWLCKQCRQQHCSKCLKDELQSQIQRRCIICEVGIHNICYQLCAIKPFKILRRDLLVCIPCMTLACQKIPEEDDD